MSFRTAMLSLAAAAAALAVTASFQAGPSLNLSDQQKSKLATCLTAKGAKLYVTTWCGACRIQEAAFGQAASKLNIVQCNDPVRKIGWIPECDRRGIKHIPTWIFRSGRRLVGVQELKTLARYAGCRLP